MKETQEQRIARAKNLLDVLLIMQDNIKMNINVASLGYVSEIIKERPETPNNEDDRKFEYGILKVKPFPLHMEQTEYYVQGYYFNSHHYNVRDVVLIIYTDLNFISSLDDTTQKPKVTIDEDFHSLKNAIIIPLEDTHKRNEE